MPYDYDLMITQGRRPRNARAHQSAIAHSDLGPGEIVHKANEIDEKSPNPKPELQIDRK